MSLNDLNKQLNIAEKKLAFYKEKKLRGGLAIDQEFVLEEDIENLQSEILELKLSIATYKNPSKSSPINLATNSKYLFLHTRIKNSAKWIVDACVTIGIGIGYFLGSLGFLAAIVIIAFAFAEKLDGCHFPSLNSDNTYANQIEKQNDIDVVKIEKAERITTYEFFSYDEDSNRVDWIMYIVNHGYWQKNEVAESVNYGQKFNICEYMNETKITDRINKDNLIGIICFGNASKEEEVSLENEEQRALIRAEKLSGCIEPIIYTETSVFTLNLGKYLENDIRSKDQRKILVIGIKEKALQANEEAALFNGLVDKRNNIGFDVRNYSLVKDNKLKITKKIN